MCVQGHDSWAGLLGPLQCVCLKSRHFCFNFIFFKKTEICTNLPGFVGRLFFFIFYIFWCPFVLNNLLHL